MINIKINQLRLEAVLADLGSEQTEKQIERAIILAGARSLVESIKQSVIANVPKATVPNPKYKDTLVDAVRFSKPRNDSSRIVHAYGTRETGSGTYRLRFFNSDTRERYQKTFNGKKLKKKRFLSHITGTNFFSKGYNQGKTTAENAMKNALQNILNNK